MISTLTLSLHRSFAVVEGFTTLEMADDVRSAALTLSGSGELRAAAELDAGERFSGASPFLPIEQRVLRNMDLQS